MNINELRLKLKDFNLEEPKQFFSHDYEYLKLMLKILKDGNIKSDRTGTGTVSLFGEMLKFDLSKGFPLLTTKEIRVKKAFEEMMMFLNGETNINFLHRFNNHLWDNWTINNFGDLGPIYGFQWTNTPKYIEISNCIEPGYIICKKESVNQFQRLIDDLINNPDSRRLIVDAWNVAQLDDMALPPCHMMFQCYVNDNTLSLQLYQRSSDSFLGQPFNIFQYGLLTHLLAYICGYKVGTFTIMFGDVHIYLNHLDQCYEQLQRIPYASPRLTLNNNSNWFPNYEALQFEDLEIKNYNYHPFIKAPIAI